MKEEGKKKSFKENFTFISTILSWTIFTLLIICAILLLYYFISTRLYAVKGEKYEPKFSLYTIISPSMVPNIKVYDVIINLRVDNPEDIQIDDVITFNSVSTEHNGKTVTHRVVSIIKDDEGNYSFQTKGDNNLIADSSPVPYSNVIGKVAMKVPQLGRVQFFVANSYGWLVLILIPALYIILKDLIKALKESTKNSKWFKVLNRPLLIGRRPKLLPEPAVTTASDEFDLPSFAKKPDVEEKSDLLAKIDESLPTDEEDEFDLDDLPKLK